MTIQEIILEVWKTRNERVSHGLRPTRILMSKEKYRELMIYHATLGDMPEGQADYISQDTLFDLEICLDNRVEFRVI